MERDQASKFVNDLLRLMISRNGSDLFLTADFPPAIKVDGRVTKVSPQPLTGQHTMALARASRFMNSPSRGVATTNGSPVVSQCAKALAAIASSSGLSAIRIRSSEPSS